MSLDTHLIVRVLLVASVAKLPISELHLHGCDWKLWRPSIFRLLDQAKFVGRYAKFDCVPDIQSLLKRVKTVWLDFKECWDPKAQDHRFCRNQAFRGRFQDFINMLPGGDKLCTETMVVAKAGPTKLVAAFPAASEPSECQCRRCLADSMLF